MGFFKDLNRLVFQQKTLDDTREMNQRLKRIEESMKSNSSSSSASASSSHSPYSDFGGPNIGGSRASDAALHRMYYEANMKSAAEQEAQGNAANAASCRAEANKHLGKF